MFEIHPAETADLSLLAQKHKLEDPVLGMIVLEHGVEKGYLLYRLQGDTAHILVVQCHDIELQQWLVRAALNAAGNRNAYMAVCRNADCFSLLSSLGFAQSDEGYSICIPEFFNRPCSGGCSQ